MFLIPTNIPGYISLASQPSHVTPTHRVALSFSTHRALPSLLPVDTPSPALAAHHHPLAFSTRRASKLHHCRLASPLQPPLNKSTPARCPAAVPPSGHRPLTCHRTAVQTPPRLSLRSSASVAAPAPLSNAVAQP
jgi:hypothetical protein